jgi:uncharacterized membrane protein
MYEMFDDVQRLIVKYSPDNVEELINIMIKEVGTSEKESLEIIKEMQKKDLIKLSREIDKTTSSLMGYIFSYDAIWFILVSLTSFSALLSIMFVVEVSSPLMQLRRILGFLLLVFLPGFSLLKYLYPSDKINPIYIMMSVGLSIAIVPLIGLFLESLPNGFNTLNNAFLIFFVTIIFSVLGVIKAYDKNKTSNDVKL